MCTAQRNVSTAPPAAVASLFVRTPTAQPTMSRLAWETSSTSTSKYRACCSTLCSRALPTALPASPPAPRSASLFLAEICAAAAARAARRAARSAFHSSRRTCSRSRRRAGDDGDLSHSPSGAAMAIRACRRCCHFVTLGSGGGRFTRAGVCCSAARGDGGGGMGEARRAKTGPRPDVTRGGARCRRSLPRA